MHNCKCNNTNISDHVNAFVDLNGVPYLLAEYLDRNNFQQIDRSLINSNIIIDQSESMRAVIDVSIDDIGRRASDGYPAIVGNNTKQNNLLKMISNNKELMNHQLNVLRRGIVVRVDYQLENYRTQQVIRSMTESFRITDRNYFLDINSRDVSDNAIIVNFCNTMVSTINEFTHGQDRMVIRITNIHLSYEMVKASPKMPRIKQSMTPCYQNECSPGIYSMENNLYRYHDMMQNRHYMAGYDPVTYGNEPVSMISPPSWSMFNRFYRFDNDGKDIIIHGQEVNDPMTKVALIPCGTVRVNRTFIINPGHRLIFKFCIWKNDVTVVNDTTEIAKCLQAPVIDHDCLCHPIDHHCHHMPETTLTTNCDCDHYINADYETIIRMLHDNRNIDYKQNQRINAISESVAELSEIVKKLIPPVTDEDPGSSDDSSTDDVVCCPECDEEHDIIEQKIDMIDTNVNNLSIAVDALNDIKPISADIIKQIVSSNAVDPDIEYPSCDPTTDNTSTNNDIQDLD